MPVSLPSMSNVRSVQPADLTSANAVVVSAVMAWPMADRVKRLSIPLLTYNEVDADHLRLIGFFDGEACQGIAAWEPALGNIGPNAELGVVLHGLYVQPARQGRGIGRALQDVVFGRAANDGAAGVLVKAERVSMSYFKTCGYEALTGASYPYTFWRSLAAEAAPSARLLNLATA